MSHVTIELPDESARLLDQPPEKMAAEIRFLTAVKLYELGKCSSGAAAEFAGLPKPAFLDEIARRGISVCEYTSEDFNRETRLG